MSIRNEIQVVVGNKHNPLPGDLRAYNSCPGMFHLDICHIPIAISAKNVYVGKILQSQKYLSRVNDRKFF